MDTQVNSNLITFRIWRGVQEVFRCNERIDGRVWTGFGRTGERGDIRAARTISRLALRIPAQLGFRCDRFLRQQSNGTKTGAAAPQPVRRQPAAVRSRRTKYSYSVPTKSSGGSSPPEPDAGADCRASSTGSDDHFTGASYVLPVRRHQGANNVNRDVGLDYLDFTGLIKVELQHHDRDHLSDASRLTGATFRRCPCPP